jgi:GIY-YIG catalytic domain
MAWWFRAVPADIDISGCVQRDGLTLLYAGISLKRPPANGKPPSSQNLRQRITYHYCGNAEGSTLRKTLGVLLANELGIELRRVGSGRRRTFGRTGEALLTDWMANHALVSWMVHPQPWLLEKALIDTLDLPLNLQDNKHNAFHANLTRRRAEAEKKARELPVLNER